MSLNGEELRSFFKDYVRLMKAACEAYEEGKDHLEAIKKEAEIMKKERESL